MKCKKGYELKKGKCKENKLFLGITNQDAKVVKRSLGTTIFALGSWGLLWSLVELFNLRNLNPLILGGLSIVVLILSFRFGIKKFKP